MHHQIPVSVIPVMDFGKTLGTSDVFVEQVELCEIPLRRDR